MTAQFLELDAIDFLSGAAARPAPGKSCGTCTACCEIVPVASIGVKAFSRCPKLRTAIDMRGPGCSIYPDRPRDCRLWSCSWLISEALPDELRPDRCGVVVDTMPDLVTVQGEEMPAAQFWVRPGFEDAWERNPVKRLIANALDLIPAVLWLMGPQGSRSARVILRSPDKSAPFVITPPIEGAGSGRYANATRKDDADRLMRAQALLRDRQSP